MPTFAENLARLRVAAVTGILPADVARWALEVIGEPDELAEAIDARNALLREAAGLMSGSTWAKASRIAAELQALSGGRRSRDDALRRLLRRVLRAGPPISSERQVYRVIAD